MPIVAGCALPDCYPAPRIPTTVDWELTVSGPAGSEVILSFQPAVAGALRSGVPVANARWNTPTELHVPVGTSVLVGMPAGPGRPAVVYPKTAIPAVGRVPGPVALEVRQFAGRVVVAGYTYRWSWPFRPSAAGPGGDQITFSGKADPLASIVLLDGQVIPAGCLNDKLRATEGLHLGVGNFAPPTATCPSSEIGVFSTCNRMALQLSPPWTPFPDEAVVKLLPLVEIPVYFWTTRGPRSDSATNESAFATVQEEVETDLARANMILTSMEVGIRFRAACIRSQFDGTSDAKASCVGFSELWEDFYQKVGYKEDSVNVYYTNPMAGNGGCWAGGVGNAGEKQLNTVLIFPQSNNATLAHELMHVLSLRVEGSENWPDSNIMGGGGDSRNCVTIGQAFRVNMNPGSAANRLGGRRGLTRACDDDEASATCPARTLDTPRTLPGWFGSYCGASTGKWEPDETAALLEWLECDDCPVPPLGGLGPAIVETLKALLEQGPSAASRMANRIHLEQAYALLLDYADTCATGRRDSKLISKEQFVRIYGSRHAVSLRMKAATALAEIGSPEARQVLKQALSWNLPADVTALLAELVTRPPHRPR